MHGLKILAFVTLRDGSVQATDFGRKGKHTGFATHHSRSKFFAILHHKDAMVGQATDDAIGSVDDQLPARLLKIL